MFAKKLLPLSIAAAFTLAAGAVSAQTVVKIGHVAPTSGPIAHLGKDMEDAAKMAVEDLNKQGVSIGGQKVTFQLLAEDDASDPKQGTAAAQKLVDANVAGVIGHLNSGTSIPASKIYYDAGIVQISPASTNPTYTKQGFDTTYRVVANDGQLGGVLGKYAVNDLKGKQVAVLDDRTAYGQGVADEFAKAVAAAGGKVVSRQYTTDRATDFQAVLTSVKSTSPQVVFFGGMDAVAGPMLRQMQQLGINAKFMGGDGLCTASLARLAGEAIGEDRVVCAEAGGVVGAEKKGLEEFRTKFKARYNTDVQLYAPYVYDSIMVMVEAMKKAGSTDPAKYGPELKKISYTGVTGPIAFDQYGDIKNGALTLYTYKGGQRTEMTVVR